MKKDHEREEKVNVLQLFFFTPVNIHGKEETSAAVTQIEEIINLFSNFLWKMLTLFLAQHSLLSEFYFLYTERDVPVPG